MNLSQYHSTNFSEKAKVIENFEHIIFLILFIALCFITLKIWYKLCRKFLADIKENLNENYFLKSLKVIPHKYIPYDNIFDVSYYVSTIIENSNIINNLALTGDTFLINLYSSSFVSLVWLLVIFTLCFAILFSIVNIILNRLILFAQNKN